MLADLHRVTGVERAEETPSFSRIYGKRIMVMGGGAQVGLVAMGAISEADRHNIRGERISIDTIPLVGEQELADAVRAVSRLPRVKMLVLAGSLMGGDITEAVKEVQAKGLRVISLNQAGSVPDVADLVVSDPTQAGVMAVMAVAETAKFDLVRQLKRRYWADLKVRLYAPLLLPSTAAAGVWMSAAARPPHRSNARIRPVEARGHRCGSTAHGM